MFRGAVFSGHGVDIILRLIHLIHNYVIDKTAVVMLPNQLQVQVRGLFNGQFVGAR